jgi:hypothetical protein
MRTREGVRKVGGGDDNGGSTEVKNRLDKSLFCWTISVVELSLKGDRDPHYQSLCQSQTYRPLCVSVYAYPSTRVPIVNQVLIIYYFDQGQTSHHRVRNRTGHATVVHKDRPSSSFCTQRRRRGLSKRWCWEVGAGSSCMSETQWRDVKTHVCKFSI